MSRKPEWHYCELYKMNFNFHIGWTQKQFEKYASEEYNHDRDYSSCNGVRLRIEDMDTGAVSSVIWVRNKNDYSGLAHECIHSALCILEERGIDARDSHGETLCYLVEYIMKAAMGKLK